VQTLRISKVHEGQRFSGGLFSSSGQKLLPPDTPITARHLEALRRFGELHVYVARDIEELVEAGVLERFDRSKLTVGQRAKRDLVSSEGRVVVEADQEIEEHHLDALSEGGHTFESRGPSQSSDAGEGEQGGSKRERILTSDARAEALLERLKSMTLRVKPLEKCDWLAPQDPENWPAPEALTEFRAQHVETLRKVYAKLEAGVEVDLEPFERLVDELLERLRHFPSRIAQLALLCRMREDYLPDHAYTVTILAMVAAARLNWPEPDVRKLGLAGLFFDVGMLLVPERIRVGACELTDVDRQRVQRHPIYSVGMLDSVRSVDPHVELAALQHHERENGTGYPYGHRSKSLGDLARLLAVADTYAAMTEPRSFRKSRLPYAAMEETLRSASSMVLCKPAVRALIQAAGLFPVGSFVRLSDGKNAHVLASNPTALDRPLIRVLSAEGEPSGPPIDLSQVPKANLTIIRPMPDPR